LSAKSVALARGNPLGTADLGRVGKGHPSQPTLRKSYINHPLDDLHSAKGLEFPQVFIVGMEEGMFPSQMSLDEGGRLEEERRLAYVGVTRAMQKLTLTYAETRRLYGKEVYHRPSRFVGELPENCVEEVRLRASVSRPVKHRSMGTPINANDSGFSLGQRVRHPKFGEGTIVNLEGSGEHSRLQIAFPGEGIKWLVAAYARLEAV